MSSAPVTTALRYPKRSVDPAVSVAGAGLPEIQPLSGSLGPYALVCQLAAGGMGSVYLATRDHGGGVQRTVALKTMHPHLAVDSRFVRMFLSEMRVISRISHSYVCRLLDAGCDSLSISSGDDSTTRSKVPFVAMEYLVGEPLSRLLPLLGGMQSDQSTMCVVKLIAQLCEGLHAAHEATDEEERPLNVVHRDISPDNLFLLYDGTVRVVDFGVSRVDGIVTTRSGPKGKFAYMSPEQLRCEPLDRRSDVWSMGVVLWELLAAAPLMPRESDVLTSRAVLDGVLPRPSEFNPRVPRWLDDIVMKALERDRCDRFANAIELGGALEECAARHAGPVSAAALGRWLDGIFPGSKAFRQDIVRRSRIALSASHTVLELPGRASSTPLPADPQPAGAVPAGSGRARRSLQRTSVMLTLLVAALAGLYNMRPELVERATPDALAEHAEAGRAAGRLELQPPASSRREQVVRAAAAGPEQATAAPVAASAPERVEAAPPSNHFDELPATAPPPASTSAPPLTPSDNPPRRGKRSVAGSAALTTAVEEGAALPASRAAQGAAESGQVYVSTPGAQVRVELDGQPAGQTPTRLRMAPGEHMLRLLRAQGGPLPVPVSVAPGQLVFVEVPLDE